MQVHGRASGTFPCVMTIVCAGDLVSRQLSGLLLRELVRGDILAAHGAAALPCAFVACHDEDTDVQSIWKDVWEEGTGSPAAAVRLYLPENLRPHLCRYV